MPVLTRNASKHCAVINEGTKMTNDTNESNVKNNPEVVNPQQGNDKTSKTEGMNKNHESTSSSSASPGFPVNPVDANTLVDTLVRQNSMLMELLKVQQNGNRPTNDITIAPDLNKSIPIFNGLGTGSQALDWIQTVNGVANLHRWPDNFKLQSVRANLEGAARHWFASREIEHWSDFERQFHKTFVGVVMMGDRWKQMSRRVQLRNENVREYYHEKVYLCRQIGMSFYESKIQILEGLYSKELSMYLLGRNHVDEDDLLSDMVEYERLDTSRSVRFRQISSTKEALLQKSVTSNPTNAVTIKKEDMKAAVGGKGAVPPRAYCFNCGSKTHLSPQCPKPKREKGACYECGSMAHQRGSCPVLMRGNDDEKKEKSAGLMNIDVVRDQDSPDECPAPYEVQCQFNVPVEESESCCVNVNAVVDTGSPISIIKSELVPNILCTTQTVSKKHFCGINGAKLDILGIFETNVIINNFEMYLKFYVVSNYTMKANAILGRDFLNRKGFKIEFKNNTVDIVKLDTGNSDETDINFKEILCIDYDDCTDKSNDNTALNVNPKLNSELRNVFSELYDVDYISNKELRNEDFDFDMKIILKHEQPITFRPRRLSYSEQRDLRVIIDELLTEGIIRESNSPYSSPIVLVRKKSGGYRLCVDYRELNKITIKDNFPTPLIDDQLDRLKNKKIFTSLDLKNGFHHVRMNEKSVQYTSFVTPLGQYEYLKMPFGLTNSPRVFNRFIQLIFRELISRGELLVYLDDLLIATETFPQHITILKEVFVLAAKYGLQFRLDKCFFGCYEIEYLGYLINEHGVRPSLKHVDAMLNYPVPKSSKQVRQFLGLASYFRRFISNFSIIAKPLYDLVKKNVDFSFGEKERDAFEYLNSTLTKTPVLAIYSPTADTELHCDASSTGFGAILFQGQAGADNKMKPVFYFSQRTSPNESKFHSFELECLAVVYAIKRFHIYLSGISFKVMTDCDSFRLTLNKKDINPRISRWALFLQNYDFEIFHRSNKNMQHVDAFSRCHAILILESNTFEQVLAIRQNTDENIVKIRDKLQNGDDKLYELRNGLVYRKENKHVRFYVPESMETNVIRSCHDDMAHVGLSKVIENISRIYWFPGMKAKVRHYIDNCLKCIEFSIPSGKKEGLLFNIPKGDKPFVTIHIDHLGPLEKTGSRNKYIFIVIDAFTKFVRLYVCRTTKSDEVIKHLRDYFRTYSKPLRIISDRGTCFTSQTFSEFVESESVKLILVASGTPRANGQVEIVNKSIVPMLAKLTDSINKWDRVLYKAEFAINNTVHRSTGQSPSMLLFGINQIGEVNDEIRRILDNIVSEDVIDFESMRTEAANRIIKSQEANKIHYDAKHKQATIYKENDYVMITNTDVTVGCNKKLIPKFRGPYIIKKVLDQDRYVVSDIEGFQVTRRPYEGIIGPDRMKRWVK